MNRNNNINRVDGINIILAIFILLLFPNFGLTQEKKIEKFFSLSCPEKRWVLLHPFIAKKAFEISVEANEIADNISNDRQLDGDKNGGQVDAFRHSYWMARMVQEINWRKARSLGRAHEKGNKKYFKKNKTEDGTIPDAISCEMDLMNNIIGIEIGLANNEAETEELVNIIKSDILQGRMWKIKKNRIGELLNEQNEKIDLNSIKGKWENSKCLVKSNYSF